MKKRTRRVMEAMVWFFLTVLISTCVIESSAEYREVPATDFNQLSVISVWVIVICAVGIVVNGLILVMTAPLNKKHL